MRNLAELNLNEGGRPVSRAAPTAAQIRAFEQAFNVSLPADYVAFLQYSNGGHPELDLITPLDPDLAGWGVNSFHYLNDDRDQHETLWKATKVWRAVLGDHVVAIADHGGGDVFLLDYRTDPPSVVGCIHDEDFELVELATSFTDFINRLELDPDLDEFDDEDD